MRIFQEGKLISRAMSWKILLRETEGGGGGVLKADGGHITERDCIGTIHVDGRGKAYFDRENGT
jgi:hypothetical protein